MNDEVQQVAEFCKATLDLNDIDLGSEYGYSSLALCVIDAVFSIGANYASTRNTVSRFCSHTGIDQVSPQNGRESAARFSISDLIGLYGRYGIEGMARDIYRNRQRTSTRSGILKSEAVLRFSETLGRFQVDHLQDIDKVLENPEFEAAIKSIPGQRSGLSLGYFYMLAGSEDHIKPDRMVMRFIQSAIGRQPSIDSAREIITKVCQILSSESIYLTPRTLDHLIWKYQRKQVSTLIALQKHSKADDATCSLASGDTLRTRDITKIATHQIRVTGVLI